PDLPRPHVIAGPRAEDVDRVADMLGKAERPLLLVGGALWSDALRDNSVFADLNRLAEEWVLPISPTHRRPQLFDATHPNYGGYMGIRVPPALIGEMKKADLMVALGERMTDTVSQSYSFPKAPQPQLPFVHVWPDANEVGKHLAPDATVTTDAGNFGSFVHRYIGFRQGQIFLSSVVGAMGSGMPMAVAAALRRPGTQIVAFLGDGGALMMGNEIATACQ